MKRHEEMEAEYVEDQMKTNVHENLQFCNEMAFFPTKLSKGIQFLYLFSSYLWKYLMFMSKGVFISC